MKKKKENSLTASHYGAVSRTALRKMDHLWQLILLNWWLSSCDLYWKCKKKAVSAELIPVIPLIWWPMFPVKLPGAAGVTSPDCWINLSSDEQMEICIQEVLLYVQEIHDFFPSTTSDFDSKQSLTHPRLYIHPLSDASTAETRKINML